MKFNTVRFKVGLLFILILGAILALYSCVLYLSLSHTLYAEIDGKLIKKCELIQEAIDDHVLLYPDRKNALERASKQVLRFSGMNFDKTLRHREKQFLLMVDKLNLRGDNVRIIDDKGNLVEISGKLHPLGTQKLFKDLPSKEKTQPLFHSIEKDGVKFRIIRYYAGQEGTENSYCIQIATSLKPVVGLLQKRLYFILITIVLILIFSSFLGGAIASRILKPVKEITEAAMRISHENLGHRVGEAHLDEEMKLLCRAFNDMIARLEKSFKHISEFNSHVAHELKTPLTIIRGEAELALRKERSIEEYQEAIRTNLGESKRMIRVVEDLLFLAKLNYRLEPSKFERIDLTDFLEEVSEQAEFLALSKEISFRSELPKEKVMVKGNPLHLRRLFLNIIDNAVKFTAKGGRVSLRMGVKGRRAETVISDTGIGIRGEDIPRIFDQFFRTEEAFSRSFLGSGLGLSIVSSIAQFHGGQLEVQSRLHEGTSFKVILPID